jgi:hypothetical protein
MSYINPFTGQTLSPSQVGYESLTISTSTSLQWPVNGNTSNVVASIIEVTATVASLNLVMPSAQQVSTGQSVLIRNIGANAFTVTDFSGNTIVSISSGIAEYIYVTGNTTDNGNWEAFTFGAGTSAANAATLAGYGLKAVNTTLNQNYTESSLFSDAVLDNTNRAQFLVWATGVGTITLPSAAAVENGWFVMIRNGGSGIVTITPVGTDTIDGNSTQQLQLTESLVVVSNGSGGYSTFAYGRSNTFAYTQLAKSITGGTYTLSAVEYANVVQEYFGLLTSNAIIVLPSTVQIYYLNNQTTGPYTLTFKTSAIGAATVTVAQGQTLTVVCDGTNVYNSSSAAGGTLTSLTIAAGSATAPSLNFVSNTDTGIYQPATGQFGIALNGSAAMTVITTGIRATVGISGGSF